MSCIAHWPQYQDGLISHPAEHCHTSATNRSSECSTASTYECSCPSARRPVGASLGETRRYDARSSSHQSGSQSVPHVYGPPTAGTSCTAYLDSAALRQEKPGDICLTQFWRISECPALPLTRREAQTGYHAPVKTNSRRWHNCWQTVGRKFSHKAVTTNTGRRECLQGHATSAQRRQARLSSS